MLNEKLQLVWSTQPVLTFCLLHLFTMLVLGVPFWFLIPAVIRLLVFGHQHTAVSANEPGPADRKIPLPPARPCHPLLPLAREHWGWEKGASQVGPTGLFKVYSTPQKSYSKDQLLSLVGFCSCAEVHSTRLLFAAHWCSRLAKHWHFYPGQRYN